MSQILAERSRRALGEKRSSVLRSASFSSGSGVRQYRPRRGTLDNNTMKTGDYYQQGIPEESSENHTKQRRYIKRAVTRNDSLEKSKEGGVNRRIKKQNSQSSLQRPKSWHNTGIMHSYSSSLDGGSSQVPPGKYVGHVQPLQDSGSPPADAYVSDIQKKSLEQFETTRSGVNSKTEEFAVSPGFVKRRVLNYSNSFNEEDKITYELQPAVIYPQVVSAMQVQNSQAGRMPNGGMSPPYQQQPGVGVANYSMVQMPQKQYASTADVHGGSEAKVPPPLPRRVDSKNRTQQLSENHVKSSSWPATKPQTSSTTDTPTQSSVISPTDLPPVKLSPSQEQVYPSQRESDHRYGGSGRRQRLSASVSSSSDYELCVAQPVVIDEETATVTEDWFQPARSHLSNSSPPGRWHSSTSIHCPPSPPTRDPGLTSDRRGPRYNTDDSLIKSYEAFLTEFEKAESSTQMSKVIEDFSEAPSSPNLTERKGSPRFMETAPIRSSPSSNAQRQPESRDGRSLHHKNSLRDISNERTWRSPKDFSATAPAGLLKVDQGNRKEVETLLAEAPRAGRPNQELSLRGNAPRNRTPINLTLMEAVDHKGQAKGRSSPQSQVRGSPGSRRREVPPTAQSLSSEDQRKLDQISSGNSILSMLQRDRHEMSFFGGEDFGKGNGPEVASDQADRLSPVGGIHYRQGSYDFPSRQNLDPSQKHNLYSSAHALNHPSTSNSTSSTSIPAEQSSSKGPSRSRNSSRYHSLGAPEYEVPPDVSMETKLPLEQVPRGLDQPQLDSNRLTVSNEASDYVNIDEAGDHIHPASDSEQSRRVSRDNRLHYHKRSDPQLDAGDYITLRRHELNYQKRSPASSSRSSSNTSWSSSGIESNRSSSGDHYSSTSSLASSGRGLGDHRNSRYSDVSMRSTSPHSSPVELNPPRFQPFRNSGGGVSRSASMNITPVTNLKPHHRTSSYDDHSFQLQRQSGATLQSRVQTETRRDSDQPQIPERSNSTVAYMESRHHVTKGSPENVESRGQQWSNDRVSAAAPTPIITATPPGKKFHTAFRFDPNSSTNPVYRIPVEPQATASHDSGHVEIAPPLHVLTVTPPRERRSPQYSPKGNQQVSPPLPPPPEEDEAALPGDLDFPPPPPELLLPSIAETQPLERATSNKDWNNREVISVARVESVRLETDPQPLPGTTTNVSSPVSLVKNALVSDKNVNTTKSEGTPGKSSPVPDNRVLDNRTTEKNGDTDNEKETAEIPEKSSLEDREENRDKEDFFPEVTESADPLVNRVLTFLSAPQTSTSQLRRLYPDSRQRSGKRRPSRVSAPSRMSSEEGNKYAGSRKESLGPSEGPLSMSLTSFLQISPGRACLLNKARGLQEGDSMGDEKDAEKLRNTKEELIERITRKVEELCNTQKEVEQEIQDTEEMGRHLQTVIEGAAPVEVHRKYTTYIGDLEKVTKLLLNLSRKLTKVDSILLGLNGDNKENKDHLEKMKGNYASRYEDAKHLKESISQRHEDISSQLEQSLPTADHEDFTYFVGVRCRLLIEAQDIADKIQLGNEQIQALKVSLEENEKDNSQTEEESSKDVNDNCNEERIKPFPS